MYQWHSITSKVSTRSCYENHGGQPHLHSPECGLWQALSMGLRIDEQSTCQGCSSGEPTDFLEDDSTKSWSKRCGKNEHVQGLLGIELQRAILRLWYMEPFWLFACMSLAWSHWAGWLIIQTFMCYMNKHIWILYTLQPCANKCSEIERLVKKWISI